MYLGVCLLGFNRTEFWRLTPVELFSLINAHITYKNMSMGGSTQASAKSEATDGFIDQIF